jgi:hypothetical protein
VRTDFSGPNSGNLNRNRISDGMHIKVSCLNCSNRLFSKLVNCTLPADPKNYIHLFPVSNVKGIMYCTCVSAANILLVKNYIIT